MSSAEGELGGNLLEDAVACMPYPGPHGGICDGGPYGVMGMGTQGNPWSAVQEVVVPMVQLWL